MLSDRAAGQASMERTEKETCLFSSGVCNIQQQRHQRPERPLRWWHMEQNGEKRVALLSLSLANDPPHIVECVGGPTRRRRGCVTEAFSGCPVAPFLVRATYTATHQLRLFLSRSPDFFCRRPRKTLRFVPRVTQTHGKVCRRSLKTHGILWQRERERHRSLLCVSTDLWAF